MLGILFYRKKQTDHLTYSNRFVPKSKQKSKKKSNILFFKRRIYKKIHGRTFLSMKKPSTS